MPYVRVHIDADDVLEELSDAEMREELARRSSRKGGGSLADFRIPAGVAKDAMEQAASLLRQIGRVDLAFKLDEARHDYVEPHDNAPQYYRFKTTPQQLTN